jgi:hypothetical protein
MMSALTMLRLKRNELLWRMLPGVMFRHRRWKPNTADGTGNQSLPTVGILRDFMGLHQPIVNACEQLGVSFKVIDIMVADWISAVRKSRCTLFFVWPNSVHPAWKNMFDERLRIIEHEFAKTVYPTCNEIWLWESKRRMSYWLDAHGVNQPKTWVLYDYEEAMAFAKNTALPIVSKPDFGDCARGVRIVRSRREALALAKRAFSNGVYVAGNHPCDRVWGCAVFQQFIPNAREWRMIRVGDSLFGYQKGRCGDFHSGTKLVEFHTPPKALLDFTMTICDACSFRSMNVDVLEDESGRYYANELQTVFGGDPWIFQMVVDGRPGRYRVEGAPGAHVYNFEPGVFCENECSNLRLRDGILAFCGTDIGFWENPRERERLIELAKTKHRPLVRVGL